MRLFLSSFGAMTLILLQSASDGKLQNITGFMEGASSVTISEGSTAAPAGRIIPVTLRGDRTRIDGKNLTYMGSRTTLQDGDIIEIAGGRTNELILSNMSLPNGQHAIVRNKGLIRARYAVLGGELQNVTVDFYNKGADEYGLQCDFLGVDSDGEGNCNGMTVKGVKLRAFNDNWNLYIGDDELDYNNGSGTVQTRNLHLDHFWVEVTEDVSNPLLEVGGAFDTRGDFGYNEGLTMSNFIINGNNHTLTSGIMWAFNHKDLTVRDWDIRDVNVSVTPGTLHARLMILNGTGQAYNIKATNYYGNILQILPAKRTSNPNGQFLYHNIIGYNNLNYSLVEVNIYEGETLFLPYVEEAWTEGNFLTAFNMGLNPHPNTHVSTCVEFFNSSGMVSNSVVINGHNDDGVVQGYNDGGTNNVSVDDNTKTQLNTTTFVPARTSSLKGAGTDNGIGFDFYGTKRPSKPTIGAVEVGD